MADTLIQANSYVVLDYTLKDQSGIVLDDSRSEGGEPIEYVHGYGMLVPGLEAGLIGLKSGDEKEIVVTAEEGFGERDEELLMEVERGDFPDPKKISPGDEFIAESPEGDEVVMRVVELKDDSVIVDANHPLAGVQLHYAVKVRDVRDATEEEIESAAAEFDEASHVHGADCGHDHSHDHEHAHDKSGELVQLGRTAPKPDLPN